MNDKDRLDKLTEAFKAQLPKMHQSQIEEEVEMAQKSLKKIAKAKIGITEAIKAVKAHSEKGTDGPLIALGLKKAPTYKMVWMPDVSIRRAAI